MEQKEVHSICFELIDAIESGSLDAVQRAILTCSIDATTLLQVADHFRALGTRSLQRNAADKRHATTKQAKGFALDYMEKNAFRFPSKIAFARDMSARIYSRYALEVKPSTIARDWLPAGVVFGPSRLPTGTPTFTT